MANYAKNTPRDIGGNPIQGVPAPYLAVANQIAVTGISSLFSLNQNTTAVEIAAPNGALAVKWIGISAAQTSVVSSIGGTLNFDHIVPAATVRRFVVPQETGGNSGGQPTTAASMFGLYNRVAVAPVVAGAISSVLLAEF